MSSLYNIGGGRAPSEAGDDVSGGGDGHTATASQSGGYGRANAGIGGAVEREDTAGTVLKGRSRAAHDERKYRYDAVRGRGSGLPFEVTRDAIMSAADAGAKLHDIHEKCGVSRENEDVLYAFDSGLWFCHTVNGASVLNPGRSKFKVPGVTQEFDYGEIRNLLGSDFRRFFRAYADDITAVNKRILAEYDPADVVKAEQWGWLQDVAYNRGLMRFPHLAHDSAEAGVRLTPTERQALHASKVITIGATPNAADRMRPNEFVSSSDKYDSSVGVHL